MPVHLAGQPADLDPLSALGLPVVEDAAHAAESALPRPQDRRALRRDLLLALRDEERSPPARAGSSRRTATTSPRRSTTLRSCAAATARSTTSPCPGYKANLSDVLAAIALVQLDKLERHRALRDAAVRALRRGRGRARRDRAARARPARHPRAPPVRRADRRERGGRDPRRVPARARRREHRHEHPLPAGAPADRVPRPLPDQPPLPVAERAGAEVLSLPLSPAHSEDDIEDAIEALRRVHARLHGMRRPRRSASLVDARRHRPRAPPTSSGRSTSARRSTSSRDADLGVLLRRGRDHGRHGRADGLALAAAARRPRDPRPARAGSPRAYFIAYTAGQVLPTSLGGDAMRIFETTRRHPGQRRRRRRARSCSSARSAARRRSRSPRSASCSRSAATTSAPTSGSSSRFVVATVFLGFVALLALDARRRSRGPCRCCGGCASSGRCGRSTRAIHAYRGHRRLLVGVDGADARRPGRSACSRSGWRRRRSASTSRRASYYVMGPLLFLVMLVPFTINGLGGARGVLRQLPRPARRQRRRGVRDRLPLLPRHARCSRCPGAVILALGGCSRARAGRRLERSG